MALIEDFTRTGNWLFKYRSWLPLAMFIIFVAALFFERDEIFTYTNIYWIISCFVVSMLGFMVRIITIGTVPKGTSGKNTSHQIADELNTTGIYSVVRHPLYLGNFLMWFGIILYSGIPWLIALLVILFALYYERIMFAEEMFLRKKYNESYIKWSLITPAFFPALGQWKKSRLSFSVKNVLKRESHAFLNTIISFSAIDFLKNYFYAEKFTLTPFWMYALAFGIVVFLVLLVIRKNTKVLDVEGR
ncbi:MAG: isoprenylcysteine carboxylmethyltransferase family protein [Bacteroidales bacterium]|nr:isoprenylcysteine carboxylmethyltransferase family protein [Bacteroidales bacterium]MCF8454806.1 isoprenylcysteine carboxylmethyltransferase family protein [Bacteroidales bacterium]